jgi:hypothetical protein
VLPVIVQAAHDDSEISEVFGVHGTLVRNLYKLKTLSHFSVVFTPKKNATGPV